jgi:hypothetical protein
MLAHKTLDKIQCLFSPCKGGFFWGTRIMFGNDPIFMDHDNGCCRARIHLIDPNGVLDQTVELV